MLKILFLIHRCYSYQYQSVWKRAFLSYGLPMGFAIIGKLCSKILADILSNASGLGYSNFLCMSHNFTFCYISETRIFNFTSKAGGAG